jgi:hypothetical protein
MHKKRRPRETRDAAAAEAVWGAPRLGVITGTQQNGYSAKEIGSNAADKRRRYEYAANHQKIIMLSLIQSACQRKNQLRQAAMRTPQISRDICRGTVN